MTQTTLAAIERPIIFSGPMVRAILAGRKTQTRRVGKFSKIPGDVPTHVVEPFPGEWIAWWTDPKAAPTTVNEFSQQVYQQGEGILCPYGRPGDRLWLKERWIPDAPRDGTWADVEFFGCKGASLSLIPLRYQKPKYCLFAATFDDPETIRWRSAIFMPRWASRLTLEIVSVRVERLHDISEADAIAEGCESHYCSPEDTASCEPGTPERELAEILEGGFLTAKNDFYGRWDTLNAKRGFPWAMNPWVWRIEFKRLDPAGGAQ